MANLPPAIPAATLILMRPVAHGPPELLLMERPDTMAFAAGALVFPGGRIEPQDWASGGDLMSAARLAALRETIEETGVAAAVEPVPDEAATAVIRDRLHAGAGLPAALAECGLKLRAEALVHFARWLPNFRETRRFDAFFFLAEAPADTPDPTPQDGEAVRAFWASASAVLAEIDASRAHAIFPTRRNLERLAQFASFEEAVANTARHPVRTITPWIEEREGRRFVCIPEDVGYPITAESLETARRR
jgi:8-oxo-dGTP pyrophosphatase MutT (NUDIX family)